MSSTIKTKGIILKIKDTPGKDKLLYIVTEAGLITAFMTSKRSAGKKSYTVDLFTYGEIILYCSDSGNYLVNSITPEEYFYGIRQDVASLYACGYLASLTIHILQDNDTDTKLLFRLLYDSFDRISKGADIKRVKPVFEFKAVKLLGFTPCLEAEKKSNTYYFDIQDGRLYTAPANGCFFVPRKIVLYIYNIIMNDDVSVFDSELTEDENNIFYNIAQQYIVYHVEKNFDALNFLNGVIEQ